MALQRRVSVVVHDGLHARPATQFVALARSFAARIEIERGGRRADAKSVVKLMLLGVRENDDVVLHADGEDAGAALDRLCEFIGSPSAVISDGPVAPSPAAIPVPVSIATGEGLAGIGASEGTAIGTAFAFFPETLIEAPRAVPAVEVPAECARLRAGVASVGAALDERRTHADLSEEDRAILDALLEILRDEEFAGAAERLVSDGVDAVTAAQRAGRAVAEGFAAADDPYLRARSDDVTGFARSLALVLLGRPEPSLADLPAGAILVADDLGAWDLARADMGRIAGIVCRRGAAVSHVSIMARAHGIPAVVGLDCSAERLMAATTVALDGRTGRVHLDPDTAARARATAAIAAEAAERAALDHWRGAGPVMRGERRIEITANLGTLQEIDAARRAGAHGVGLFRTEFLFMGRRTLPTESEQADTYRRLCEAFYPDAVVIRTLDVGGDKPIAGIVVPPEDNPFLGWRGVRMCLGRPDVFKPQLRALLRAALVGNLRVMIPMVVEPAEVAAVRALIKTCAAELTAEGVAHAPFSLGIMIETPAAALLAPEFAREVAFFSIGTNDLTQYIMAADRLNPLVAGLNRTEHPAVMRAIELTCRAAEAAGIPVAICGEAAARPDLIPIFLRMGVTELSMSPAAIPRAKKVVAES